MSTPAPLDVEFSDGQTTFEVGLLANRAWTRRDGVWVRWFTDEYADSAPANPLTADDAWIARQIAHGRHRLAMDQAQVRGGDVTIGPGNHICRPEHEEPDAHVPADLPPALPDTSGWVKRAPGDVIEAGTPFIVHGVADQEVELQDAMDAAYWTPPPVPREPWRVLSSEPKLASVTYTIDGDARLFEGRAFIDGDSVKCWDGEAGLFVTWLHNVTAVELLHTHDPVTHVPVERALIERAARMADAGVPKELRGDRYVLVPEFIEDLAALADGAQS